jgi:hypothetical protein
MIKTTIEEKFTAKLARDSASLLFSTFISLYCNKKIQKRNN